MTTAAAPLRPTLQFGPTPMFVAAVSGVTYPIRDRDGQPLPTFPRTAPLLTEVPADLPTLDVVTPFGPLTLTFRDVGESTAREHVGGQGWVEVCNGRQVSYTGDLRVNGVLIRSQGAAGWHVHYRDGGESFVTLDDEYGASSNRRINETTGRAGYLDDLTSSMRSKLYGLVSSLVAAVVLAHPDYVFAAEVVTGRAEAERKKDAFAEAQKLAEEARFAAVAADKHADDVAAGYAQWVAAVQASGETPAGPAPAAPSHATPGARRAARRVGEGR